MLICAVFALGVQGMLSGAGFGVPMMMGATLLMDANKELDKEGLIKYEQERLAALKKESEEANL